MAQDFQRPPGVSFSFGGMNCTTVADKLPPDKYTFAQNVRGYSDKSIRVRPGYDPVINTMTGQAVQALRAYSTVGTDNNPRYLMKIGANIYLDTGAAVDGGYATGLGASLIPYRPNESPQSWMYAGDANQYRKLSAPDAVTGAVTASKVGIVEPQVPVDAAIFESFFTPLATSTPGHTINYTHGGTASGITDTPKVTDSVVAVFQDPALAGGALNEYIIQTASSTQQYQKNEFISIGTPDIDCYQVKDVFIPLFSPISITSIYYYAGSTGRCVIVPSNIGQDTYDGSGTIYEQTILSGLRRGSLITLGGTETCMVLGVTIGPQGSICFEVSTNNTHTSGETVTGQKAIRVLQSSAYNGTTPIPPTAGTAISAHFAEFSVTTGVGFIQSPVGLANPFAYNNIAYQDGDYIHLSILAQFINNVNEIKVLFDVGDGSFTQNFYYYSIRPADIAAGVANDSTQLGSAQITAQRSLIDEESSLHGQVASSVQTAAGDNQWSDVIWPISSMIRVGNDQTLSLLNMNSYQILVNVEADTNIGFHTVDIFGGFATDIGDAGAPYQYIVRPRSSLTGAKGNPSPPMRYGVYPRRELVKVVLPTSYPDPQMDTWDIFRFGGPLDGYVYLGSVPLAAGQYMDQYADEVIESNDRADYDNFEPWPTVDFPFNATASQLNGSTAVVTVPTAQIPNVLRYLPGNDVTIGQQVYTLWTRPTLISGNNVLFQFVENAGSGTSQALSIYEPTMANQTLPYLWGPSEQGGNIFGCGDTLRPGFVYFCKNFDPDSAPDSYSIELSPPSEPLLGGELLNGNSYVASTTKWWFLRPSLGGTNQFTPLEVPVGRGLAAPYGHDTDGKLIYFVAKDGIYATAGGPGESLTDEDLYVLFPHEGVAGQNYVYNGNILYAPDYARSETFRLAYCNSYLFFDYQDTTGTPRTLVYDIRHKAWSTDVSVDQPTIHYAIEQQEGSLGSEDVLYGLLVAGSASGVLSKAQDGVVDGTHPITWALGTMEFTGGDDRAPKLFGDMFLDITNVAPSSGSNTMAVTPVSFGAGISSPIVVASAGGRQQLPLGLPAGGIYEFSMGLFFSGTVVAAPATPITLYTWQPSYIPKPETTATRAGDWDNCGYAGAKWIQGFILEADTIDAVKQLGIRNSDDLVLQQVFPIQHNGQSEIAYSFLTPFVSHLVRYEPQDGVDWRFFGIRWVFELTPENVTTWQTQGTALGWQGYGHVYAIDLAYSATAAVTFTMTYDGTTQTFILPATGGVYTKLWMTPAANKGKIYSFKFQTTGQMQLWLDDMVYLVGGWGRGDAYRNYYTTGGSRGDKAQL